MNRYYHIYKNYYSGKWVVCIATGIKYGPFHAQLLTFPGWLEALEFVRDRCTHDLHLKLQRDFTKRWSETRRNLKNP